MKKNIFSLLIILVVVLSICVSCKSTPDTSDELASQAASEARKRAIDFEAPGYFPSEWEEIETKYNAAGSADDFKAAADAYDDIFKKALPLYAQAKEDEIMASREHLIGTGFTEFIPDHLKRTDEIALSAKEQYDAGDYYKARETAAAALEEYETLNKGARVFSARQEIIDRGFAQYDSENFIRADEVAQAALEAYDTGNKDDAVSKAEEAMLRYNIVLSNGWTAYASSRKESAASERELALAERANIASRDTFRRADTFFTQAEEQLAAEKFGDAALNYVEAEAFFAISRQETEEKRIRAEETIRLAEEKIEESSGAAMEAERVMEGGVR